MFSTLARHHSAVLLGGSAIVFGAWLSTACNHGGALPPSTMTDGGAAGATGGDASPAGTGARSGASSEPQGGSGSVGATGGGGTEMSSGGTEMSSGGTETSTSGRGSSDPGVPDGGVAGADGTGQGGAPLLMFPCGDCENHWVCGGGDILLTGEEDGCYLAGLPGHKLLAPNGTVTEGGEVVGKATKFGPQVGLYYPDGTQWRYCGRTPLCPTQL